MSNFNWKVKKKPFTRQCQKVEIRLSLDDGGVVYRVDVVALFRYNHDEKKWNYEETQLRMWSSWLYLSEDDFDRFSKELKERIEEAKGLLKINE